LVLGKQKSTTAAVPCVINFANGRASRLGVVLLLAAAPSNRRTV
jgi:hypothetical protein